MGIGSSIAQDNVSCGCCVRRKASNRCCSDTDGEQPSAAYFCNGYGGSTFRNLILGLPPSLVTSPDTPWYWLVCSLLVYYSPGDVVFSSLQSKRSLSRQLMLFGEAVDSATTLCGSYEMGMQLHPNSAAAPLVTAAAAALGGSLFRYMEREGRQGIRDTTGGSQCVEWA